MKTAVKVLSILAIVGFALLFIIFLFMSFGIKDLVQTAYNEGTLVSNGVKVTTQAELESVKNLMFTIFMIITFVFGACTVLPIINLVTANNPNNILHLILGIVDIISGGCIILGIIQILLYSELNSQAATQS